MKNNSSRKLVTDILDKIYSVCDPTDITVCGSYARGLDVCGDLDLITTKKVASAIISIFNAGITAKGDKLCRLELPIHNNPFQVDIRFSDDLSARELLFLTLHENGNMYFNIVMRSIAKNLGMKLNEYDLVVVGGDQVPLSELTEECIFNQLGLKYIPLEDRTHSSIVSVYRTINRYKR